VSEALTGPEQRKLNDLETVIELGLQTFVEVGAALSIIREQRLYRESHGTFEDYCRERWGWTRQRAAQLIDASDTVAALSTIVDTPPTNEGQARELVSVPQEERAEVWTEAVRTAPIKNGKPKVTARHVRDTAERRAGSNGKPFSELVREGMELSEDANEAARATGLSLRAFRRGRYVLSLVGDDKLTDKQAAAVSKSVAMMDEAGTATDAAWETVEPIVVAKFGPLNLRQGVGVTGAADAHMENFLRAYSTLIQVCMASRDIDVPLLHREDRERIKAEITTAIDKLKDLRARVGTRGQA